MAEDEKFPLNQRERRFSECLKGLPADWRLQLKNLVLEAKGPTESRTQQQLASNLKIATRTLSWILNPKAEWEAGGAPAIRSLCNLGRRLEEQGVPKGFQRMLTALGIKEDSTLARESSFESARTGSSQHDVLSARLRAVRLRLDEIAIVSSDPMALMRKVERFLDELEEAIE